jgi:hypothetical protein
MLCNINCSREGIALCQICLQICHIKSFAVQETRILLGITCLEYQNKSFGWPAAESPTPLISSDYSSFVVDLIGSESPMANKQFYHNIDQQ